MLEIHRALIADLGYGAYAWMLRLRGVNGKVNTKSLWGFILQQKLVDKGLESGCGRL